MVKQQQSPKIPVGTVAVDCDKVIFDIKRIVLKVSPHYKKRNEEFQRSKKMKVKENLSRWLLDEEIIRNFIQQINQEDIWFVGIHPNWPAWKYYGCDGIIDQRNDLNYVIIFFLDDDNPEVIGMVTVYPV
jgi:hypothetical protein